MPLACDERPDYKAFRVGLFGLDKLHHVDRTVQRLADALAALGLKPGQALWAQIKAVALLA